MSIKEMRGERFTCVHVISSAEYIFGFDPPHRIERILASEDLHTDNKSDINSHQYALMWPKSPIGFPW